MHRGASLALGRTENDGIRCLYHGWKFAVDGTILDTPNHSDPRVRERMKAPCYPVREEGGIDLDLHRRQEEGSAFPALQLHEREAPSTAP